jgi:hypothetical protein
LRGIGTCDELLDPPTFSLIIDANTELAMDIIPLWQRKTCSTYEKIINFNRLVEKQIRNYLSLHIEGAIIVFVPSFEEFPEKMWSCVVHTFTHFSALDEVQNQKETSTK